MDQLLTDFETQYSRRDHLDQCPLIYVQWILATLTQNSLERENTDAGRLRKQIDNLASYFDCITQNSK